MCALKSRKFPLDAPKSCPILVLNGLLSIFESTESNGLSPFSFTEGFGRIEHTSITRFYTPVCVCVVTGFVLMHV